MLAVKKPSRPMAMASVPTAFSPRASPFLLLEQYSRFGSSSSCVVGQGLFLLGNWLIRWARHNRDFSKTLRSYQSIGRINVQSDAIVGFFNKDIKTIPLPGQASNPI